MIEVAETTIAALSAALDELYEPTETERALLFALEDHPLSLIEVCQALEKSELRIRHLLGDLERRGKVVRYQIEGVGFYKLVR